MNTAGRTNRPLGRSTTTARWPVPRGGRRQGGATGPWPGYSMGRPANILSTVTERAYTYLMANRDRVASARFTPAELRAIDRWAASNRVSRGDAIRVAALISARTANMLTPTEAVVASKLTPEQRARFIALRRQHRGPLAPTTSSPTTSSPEPVQRLQLQPPASPPRHLVTASRQPVYGLPVAIVPPRPAPHLVKGGR